jgi:AcrR family transcriptional regulator
VPTPVRGLTQPQRVETSARKLLEAASALIVEKGWEAITAAEIGRRAGYSRAMVHARYGSKDAILAAFLHEYVRRLDPDPDPEADGLRQVLAHFDRIQDLHACDPDILRAMFIATFEAVKTTSPLRDRVSEQLRDGTAKVEAALRNGIADGSIRSDADVSAAATDITSAVFGVGFSWVVLPERELVRDLDAVRSRVIRDYAGVQPE